MDIEVGEEYDEGGGIGQECIVHPLGEIAVNVQ